MWITYDILELCDDKRKLKEATKSNPEMKENYKQINIIIRKLMKKAKENWIQSQCTSTNEEMSNKNIEEIIKSLPNINNTDKVNKAKNNDNLKQK